MAPRRQQREPERKEAQSSQQRGREGAGKDCRRLAHGQDCSGGAPARALAGHVARSNRATEEGP